MAAVVGLWVLATWCAEVAWGGFTVADYPVVLLFLGPLYGSAALLIREAARRAGAGWPGIVMLAAAFGLVQAGLVDQSLFDRAALEGTQFAEWGRQAAVTMVFGVSAEQLFDFVGGHVWWSICAPIAIVEACVAPDRRAVPWLGRTGLAVAVALYLVGSALIWSDSGHVASGVQVGVVVVVVVGLVAGALLPRRCKPAQREALVEPAQREAPIGPVAQSEGTVAQRDGPAERAWSGRRVHPLVLGAVVLAGHLATWFYGSQWLGVGLRLVTLVVVGTVAVWWARSPRHVVAAWGAGLVAAAGAAWIAPPYAAAESWLMVVSDATGSVIVASVLVLAYRRAGRSVAGAAHADGPAVRTAGP